LFELAGLGRERGLDGAVRWFMAAMKKAEDQARAGKRRKRTVALVDDTGKPVRAGRFKVPDDVLKRAEIIGGDK